MTSQVTDRQKNPTFLVTKLGMVIQDLKHVLPTLKLLHSFAAMGHLKYAGNLTRSH